MKVAGLKPCDLQLAVAPCSGSSEAQEIMLVSLGTTQADSFERKDRWESDAGFYCANEFGAVQMICKGNLFVRIHVMVENSNGKNADDIIETVWESIGEVRTI